MTRSAFAVCCALCIASPACGQDAQLFRVVIPNGLTLDALSGTQQTTHPQTSSDVTFTDSNWFVNANPLWGANATFSAAPFVNLNDAGSHRDVHLELHSLDNNSFISQLFGIQWPWVYETIADQTDYGAGDNQATVSLNSTFAGSAQVSVRVRFITDDFTTLTAGTYQTTVVGTITAN